MTDPDLEFFFDPVCPFCWVTSRWVTNVARQRPLEIIWRPLSLRILNEPIGYETRPPGYPEAHQRGLEMVRVVAAAREAYGPAVVGDLYTAMGEAVWSVPPPEEATFEAVLGETSRPRDLPAILARAGLPEDLAALLMRRAATLPSVPRPRKRWIEPEAASAPRSCRSPRQMARPSARSSMTRRTARRR